MVKRIDYDSFGNIITDTDTTLEIPFGFAGGLHDRNTGLVRFGYRDYDPDVGRWTAKDPILFEGGQTDLYGYCLNDPISLFDPSGKQVNSPTFSEKLLEHFGDIIDWDRSIEQKIEELEREEPARFEDWRRCEAKCLELYRGDCP